MAEVLRPTHSTITIPSDPTSSLFTNPGTLLMPPCTLPLLITTTKNEAGSAIQQIFPVPAPASNNTFTATLFALVGAERAATLVSNLAYTMNHGNDSVRKTLERISTDGVWRCPNRDVARSWAAAGGNVWVGKWVEGATYSSNQGTYCQQQGVVCHEDDLYPTFGTAPPTDDIKDLEDEVINRWANFIVHLDPNTASDESQSWGWRGGRRAGRGQAIIDQWAKYTGEADVYAIGKDQVAPCTAPWGTDFPHDWQLWP